jgi:prepilin-type N-terminal cleavage/methylation domain-containing protein
MKPCKKSPGFSLIELIICLFLLGGLYVFSTYGYHKFLVRYRLEGAARGIASDFQAARMKAIAQNRSYRIVIRPEKGEYFLEKESFSPPGTWRGAEEGWVRKFNDPQNPYYFPGVVIVNRTYDPVFLPRGSVIGTTVLIKNEGGQRKIVLSSQGRIRMEE